MIMIRKMEPGESIQVKKLARKAFVGIERFFISTPKNTMVAVVDDKIVGGINIKIIESNGKKIGYFDAAFIDPHYHGQGIGKMLYEATTKYLWESGCDALSALVKDDNVASWKLFENNGFCLTSFVEATKHLGFLTMMKQYFTTPFFISNGMEYYLVVKNQKVMPKKVISSRQIIWFILANFILMLTSMLTRSAMQFSVFISSYLFLLSVGVITGYIGTCFSKRQWHFRVNSGGGVIVALINMIEIYPLIGNWYPLQYENTKSFRKDMGITALCEWLFLLIITLISYVFGAEYLFLAYTYQIGSILLLYRILALYPFESFGGRRVYDWNKKIYLAMSIVTIIIFGLIAI